MELLEVTDTKSIAILEYIKEFTKVLDKKGYVVSTVNWSNALFRRSPLKHFHYSNSTVKVIIPLLVSFTTNIITLHDVLPRNPRFKKFISPILYTIINFKVKFIIVHSHYSAELLRDTYPFINSNKIKVIPFGLTPINYSREESWTYRHEFDIASSDVVFLYVGYIKKTKGVFDAIDIIGKQKQTNIKFFIVGKPSDEEALMRLQQITDKRIIYKGFLSDEELNKLIIASDILLSLRHDSVGETSAAIINMFKRSKPVLATNVGSTKEVVENAGLLCELRREDMESYIERYIQDRKLREQLSKNAEIMRKKYDWEILVSNYYAVFQSI